MPILKCLICKSNLYVKPSHLKLGWGKYCSTSCRAKSQLKGKTVNCHICSLEVYRSPKSLKDSKSQNFFCGKRCQTIWRNKEMYTQEEHPNWKGGESSYRRLMNSSDKIKKCVLCKTTDFRILVVHHIDKDRKNNKLSNLEWLCHNCHYLVHHFEDERKKFILNID